MRKIRNLQVFVLNLFTSGIQGLYEYGSEDKESFKASNALINLIQDMER